MNNMFKWRLFKKTKLKHLDKNYQKFWISNLTISQLLQLFLPLKCYKKNDKMQENICKFWIKNLYNQNFKKILNEDD